MWKCSKCGEQLEDQFELCWSCGTSKEGEEDPDFHHSDVAPPPSPELEEIQGMPENLVTLTTCSLPAEAHALKIHLEAEQIPVFLADEFTVTMDWLLSNAIGGIKIQVPEADYEKALDVLDRFEETKPKPRVGEDDEDENEPA